jgi:hypothetical protein
LDYAQKAIATGSGNLDAFAIEGGAYTDLGDYDEAVAATRIRIRLLKRLLALHSPSRVDLKNAIHPIQRIQIASIPHFFQFSRKHLHVMWRYG